MRRQRRLGAQRPQKAWGKNAISTPWMWKHRWGEAPTGPSKQWLGDATKQKAKGAVVRTRIARPRSYVGQCESNKANVGHPKLNAVYETPWTIPHGASQSLTRHIETQFSETGTKQQATSRRARGPSKRVAQEATKRTKKNEANSEPKCKGWKVDRCWQNRRLWRPVSWSSSAAM